MFFLLAIAAFISAAVFAKSESVPLAAGRINQVCSEKPDQETCLAKEFASLTNSTSLQNSFLVLSQLQQINSTSAGCHFIAHSIAGAEVAKDPARWREIMVSDCPTDCSYGCSHGALEAYAENKPQGEISQDDWLGICQSGHRSACTHILGHLLLVEFSNNIRSALDLCWKLPNSKSEIFDCLNGVFMERVTAFNLIQHGLVDSSAQEGSKMLSAHEEMCRNHSGLEGIACWRVLPYAAVEKFNYQPQKLINYCESSPTPDTSGECQVEAINLYNAHLSWNLPQSKTICDSSSKDPVFKERCYAQLAAGLLETSPQDSPAAVKFCNSLAESFLSYCFRMIGHTLSISEPENKDKLALSCNDAPAPYQKECRQGGVVKLRPFLAN